MRNHNRPYVLLPPNLSDEAAYQFLDFLLELTTAFENHYAHQIRRHLRDDAPGADRPEPDDPWEDQDLPF